ncbi:MAG: hypothetical protein V1755_00040 [Chloroflexota bacterium]
MTSSAANAIVIIPTYWTWPSGDSHRPVTGAYDHPTPLDGESTLPPLLDDLSNQREGGLRVLILVGMAHPDLSPAAAEHVRQLLESYRKRLDLRICDEAAASRLRELLDPTGSQAELFHLQSYAGIRNLQLLVPHILSAETVVALDDDERVRPDYAERALRTIGERMDGERVLGLAGPYLQLDGGVMLSEKPSTGNVFRDKARHINAAMRMLMAKGSGPIPSPMALGGNMIFHRDLFTQVCFDPGITRGEDIDYLINARLQGIGWWFDPNLTILHLPPQRHETPPYQRMREDVFRFIYEREKLRLDDEVKPAWLEPYPGALLGDDLKGQALAALETEATPEMIGRFGNPQVVVKEAEAHAERSAPRYPAFADAWRELMTRVAKDSSLRLASAAVFPRL